MPVVTYVAAVRAAPFERTPSVEVATYSTGTEEVCSASQPKQASITQRAGLTRRPPSRAQANFIELEKWKGAFNRAMRSFHRASGGVVMVLSKEEKKLATQKLATPVGARAAGDACVSCACSAHSADPPRTRHACAALHLGRPRVAAHLCVSRPP
eukprot:5287013-Prymnesium_polylepis.1